MSLLLVSGRYPPRSDGIGDYTAGLAQALRRAGWPLAVLTAGVAVGEGSRGRGSPEEAMPPLAGFGVSPRTWGRVGQLGAHTAPVLQVPRWDAAGLRTALGLLRRQRPAAVVWQYNPFSYGRKGLCPEYALLPWLARCVTRAPVVVTLHELAYPWGRGGGRGLVWAVVQRLQLALVARTATALVATTGPRAAWLRRRWPQAHVARIPVGSSLPAAEIGARARQAVRARFGLPAEAYLLGAFGTLNDGRPLGGTLGALVRLPDTWLVWVGDLRGAAHVRERWQRLADTLGVGERVRWLGRLAAHDAADVLAACDALLAIYDEGLSGRRTTLAAVLAQGRPVLGTIGPATDADLFAPGLAFKPVADEAASIAEAVTRLRADPSRAACLAAGARATFARWLAWERIAAAYGKLLAELGVERPAVRASVAADGSPARAGGRVDEREDSKGGSAPFGDIPCGGVGPNAVDGILEGER